MNWFQNLIDQFKFVFVEGDRYQQMLTGLKNTLLITAGALVIGIVIGVVIASIRSSFDKNKESLKMRGGIGYYILAVLNAICRVYLTIIRGTPVVVQLMIAYFIVFVFNDRINGKCIVLDQFVPDRKNIKLFYLCSRHAYAVIH